MLTFCNAIEPPLTLRGPRGLLAVSHQMYLWLSGIWGTASLRKNTSQHDILCLTLMYLFAQDLITNIIFCRFSLISWRSLIMLFVYSCLICLFLSVILECLLTSEHSVKIYSILRYISLEIQWLFIWLSVILHLNFNDLSLNSFIVQAI